MTNFIDTDTAAAAAFAAIASAAGKDGKRGQRRAADRRAKARRAALAPAREAEGRARQDELDRLGQTRKGRPEPRSVPMGTTGSRRLVWDGGSWNRHGLDKLVGEAIASLRDKAGVELPANMAWHGPALGFSANPKARLPRDMKFGRKGDGHCIVEEVARFAGFLRKIAECKQELPLLLRFLRATQHSDGFRGGFNSPRTKGNLWQIAKRFGYNPFRLESKLGRVRYSADRKLKPYGVRVSLPAIAHALGHGSVKTNKLAHRAAANTLDEVLERVLGVFAYGKDPYMLARGLKETLRRLRKVRDEDRGWVPGDAEYSAIRGRNGRLLATRFALRWVGQGYFGSLRDALVAADAGIRTTDLKIDGVVIGQAGYFCNPHDAHNAAGLWAHLSEGDRRPVFSILRDYEIPREGRYAERRYLSIEQLMLPDGKIVWEASCGKSSKLFNVHSARDALRMAEDHFELNATQKVA